MKEMAPTYSRLRKSRFQQAAVRAHRGAFMWFGRVMDGLRLHADTDVLQGYKGQWSYVTTIWEMKLNHPRSESGVHEEPKAAQTATGLNET